MTELKPRPFCVGNARKDAEALREILVDDCVDFPHVVHTMLHKAADLIESLSAELEQVKRERDAAVKDLRTFTEPCRACAHVGSNDICHECRFELIEGHHITRTNWQWRGAKEEE